VFKLAWQARLQNMGYFHAKPQGKQRAQRKSFVNLCVSVPWWFKKQETTKTPGHEDAQFSSFVSLCVFVVQ
jgi:hypothetical protein